MKRWAGLFAVLLGVGLAQAVSAPADAFCSKSHFYQKPPHYFIGSATGDSALAGPGAVEVRGGAGHFGRSVEGPIHGQLIRVQAFGTESGLRADQHPVAVVVPWDYDASCGTVRWGGSSIFVEPGTVGVYQSRLRPEADWVASVPTFDAFTPEAEGFPHDISAQYRRRWGEQTDMSAEELFALFEAWPSRERIATEGWGAVWPVLAPLYADSASRDRAPIREITWTMASEANRAQARGSIPPLTGTYRVSAELPSGAIETFHLRTADRADHHWMRRTFSEPPQSLADHVADGWDIGYWYALVETGLATDSAGLGRSGGRISMAWDSTFVGGRWAWVGDLHPGQLLEVLGYSAEYDDFASRWSDELEPWRRRQRADPAEMHFYRSGSGEVSFETTYTLADGTAVTMRGERISDTAVAHGR